MTFDFLEALLAVCITGVGLVLRTSFPDSGMPHPLYLLAEWYLCGGRCRACPSDHWKWTKESSDLQCVTDSSGGDCGWNDFKK